MQIQFATQSYRSQSLPLSAQRCVNLYAEMQPKDAKSQVAVFGTPGLSEFARCGTGPIRGMHLMNDAAHVVSGNQLYRLDSNGQSSLLGGVITGGGIVKMSDNGSQLCVVNGVNGYIYSTSIGFQLISSPNFFAANSASFIDGYFAFDRLGTNEWFISNLLDGSAYDGLDFASAEVQPDNVVSIISIHETLLIFGAKTIETWYDAGGANFPFQRYDGATVERGCGAARSPIKEDNTTFWVGDDRIFYRLNGITPIRVSTHAVEAAWQGYQTVSDAFTLGFTHNGHKFIYVTFPSANATWGFDLATGYWHERESWDENNNPMGRWRANCALDAYDKVLIGDANSNRIGYINANTFTEYGNTMQALAVSPTIHSDRKRVTTSSFELDMEVGVGAESGQGVDPQAMLRWSDNGGRSFSNTQPWESIGARGDFGHRMLWTRLGESRQRIFEVTITDPIPRTIIAAHAGLRAGPT
jgi:hypothetical protein